jgi:hypothetical protein
VSFLAPGFLVAAIGAAAAVVALHFIVMRQPPNAIFPTARFIPARPAVARTVARSPEDLVVLVLRTLALILIGAAFARPVWHARRAIVARIVVADRSRAVADAREVADSVRRMVSTGDVLVLFDSASRVIETHAADSVAALARVEARGELSPALVQAIRAASKVRDRVDSIEIVVVSPVMREEVDAATDTIRRTWPGDVRLVRVAARRDTVAGAQPTVQWPADAHVLGARPRVPVDTARAVVAGGAVVVAPFERRWLVDTVKARVVARWVDGAPAAVERLDGAACVRDVAIPLPAEGDLVLRPEFRRFEAVLKRPCGRAGDAGRGVVAPWVTDSALPRRVPSSALRTGTIPPSQFAMWLLGLAALALVLELIVRPKR